MGKIRLSQYLDKEPSPAEERPRAPRGGDRGGRGGDRGPRGGSGGGGNRDRFQPRRRD